MLYLTCGKYNNNNENNCYSLFFATSHTLLYLFTHLCHSFQSVFADVACVRGIARLLQTCVVCNNDRWYSANYTPPENAKKVEFLAIVQTICSNCGLGDQKQEPSFRTTKRSRNRKRSRCKSVGLFGGHFGQTYLVV